MPLPRKICKPRTTLRLRTSLGRAREAREASTVVQWVQWDQYSGTVRPVQLHSETVRPVQLYSETSTAGPVQWDPVQWDQYSGTQYSGTGTLPVPCTGTSTHYPVPYPYCTVPSTHYPVPYPPYTDVLSTEPTALSLRGLAVLTVLPNPVCKRAVVFGPVCIFGHSKHA